MSLFIVFVYLKSWFPAQVRCTVLPQLTWSFTRGCGSSEKFTRRLLRSERLYFRDTHGTSRKNLSHFVSSLLVLQRFWTKWHTRSHPCRTEIFPSRSPSYPTSLLNPPWKILLDLGQHSCSEFWTNLIPFYPHLTGLPHQSLRRSKDSRQSHTSQWQLWESIASDNHVQRNYHQTWDHVPGTGSDCRLPQEEVQATEEERLEEVGVIWFDFLLLMLFINNYIIIY